MKLLLRPQAWNDIGESMDYLKAGAGVQTAARFYQRVRQTLKQLCLHPGMGRPQPDLKPAGIRSWRVAGPFQRWLIFYRTTEAGLEVLRVKHGAMDLPALFQGSEKG